MAKFKQKNQAVLLRQKGNSIKDISRMVRVSKSTVSNWCRDIRLTRKQLDNLVKKQRDGSYKGRMRAMEKKRLVRMKEEALLLRIGVKEVGRIRKRDLFIAGIAIYWSEGYTYSSGVGVGFTNSDPRMVLLMLHWFKKICKVSNDRFALSIRINHAHKKRTKEMEIYWSKLTKIPLSQFNKTILIKSNSSKVFPKSKPYYGTLRIVVLRSTKLSRKINGWIVGIAKC